MAERSPWLANHFESLEQQNATETFGMWIFLMTELMLFGGLFLGYTVYRLIYPDAWVEGSRHLNVLIGSVNTVVLLMSSVTMALAVQDARVGNRKWAGAESYIHGRAGPVFLALKAVEYYQHFQEREGSADRQIQPDRGGCLAVDPAQPQPSHDDPRQRDQSEHEHRDGLQQVRGHAPGSAEKRRGRVPRRVGIRLSAGRRRRGMSKMATPAPKAATEASHQHSVRTGSPAPVPCNDHGHDGTAEDHDVGVADEGRDLGPQRNQQGRPMCAGGHWLFGRRDRRQQRPGTSPDERGVGERRHVVEPREGQRRPR